MTIYKAFARPHLDYGDVIYDEACNKTFHRKPVSIQYDACLALSRAIKTLSREKLYQEFWLGLPPTSTLVQETFLILQDF